MSEKYCDIKFGNLGQLSSEIWVILQVYPLTFPQFVHHKFLLKFMNIQIILFSYLHIRYEHYVAALFWYQVCYSRANINRDRSNFVSIPPWMFLFFHSFLFFHWKSWIVKSDNLHIRPASKSAMFMNKFDTKFRIQCRVAAEIYKYFL